MMELGGNANAKTFFRDHGVNELELESKYQTRAAELYKKHLKDLVDKERKKYLLVLPFMSHIMFRIAAAAAPAPVVAAAVAPKVESPAASSSPAHKPKKEAAPSFQWEAQEEQEDEPAVKYTPASSKSTQEARATSTGAAGRLGATKVRNIIPSMFVGLISSQAANKNFFADFDLEDDEKEEQELPPPPTNKSRGQVDDV